MTLVEGAGQGRRRLGRSLAWGGVYAAILLAWSALALMAPQRPAAEGLEPWLLEALCRPAGEAGPGALLGMWGLMSLAMMLPGFVPAARTFDALGACGARDGTGLAALVGGYLAVWAGFSALGALAQAELSRAGLLDGQGASRSALLTAALFAGAGLYQFSALKDACLTRCRHPLSFFLQHWRPGAGAAFAMGARLGLACLGCCWALMALAFVGGTMHLGWMAAATLFMTMEKLDPPGRALTRPAGVLLLAAGGWTLAAGPI